MILKVRLATATALMALAISSQPVSAQREIVQPLPSDGERDLSEALTRLARDATNVGALVDAGDAALELGDIDAAIGFFGRANELSPDNPRIKLGQARAYTRSRRPIEALRLFAEAERAGIRNAQMAEDRALAFDLVGDSRSAQQLYRLALDNGAGAETRRRLALSQAISGNRDGFEATLLPLLEEGDLAAFRTRSFGLAILGDTAEAKTIATTSLPAGLGSQMASYLDIMPRLTNAQQAAAGNLGVFPQTSSIGSDDAEVAGYAGAPVRLAGSVQPPAPNAQTAPAPAPAPAPPPKRALELTPLPEPTVAPAPAPPEPAPDNAGQPVVQDTVEYRQARATTPFDRRWGLDERTVVVRNTSVPGSAELSNQGGVSPAQSSAGSATQGVSTPAPSLATTVNEPTRQGPTEDAVVIAQAGNASSAAAVDVPTAGVELEPESRTLSEPASLSVADAFGSFTLAPTRPAPTASGGVDITRIEIPRERAEPEPPPPPKHPSRHWVQVATGKDLSALGFDWRRIARKADGALEGKGPFTTPWGEANRLLSGPYPSATAAREMMNRLKAMDIDSFTFTSDTGQAIEPL